MGYRKKLLKQENIDRANRLLESRIRRSLMTEQQPVSPPLQQIGDANNDGIVNQQGNLTTSTTSTTTTPPIACDPPPGGCKPGHVWIPWNALGTGCICQPDGDNGPDIENSTCDISWASTCAQQELATGGGLGGQNSWDPWLALRQTGWDSVGCQHLQNVVNWTTDQLNSGVTGPNAPNPNTPLNPTQILRKTAKREWAQCQAAQCDCPPLNVPALTGGPTPPPPPNPNPLAGTGGIKPEKRPTKAPKSPKVPKTDKKGVDTKGGKDKKEDKELNEQINKMRSLWNYNK